MNGERTYSDRTKALMKIIEDGLPSPGEPRHVAVIGAGMSGMVTASLLRDAGYQVTIFEANTRVGGRVKTIREPFSPGQFGEAGAMRLVTSYQLVFKYIERFGLETFTFINHDVSGVEKIFINGFMTDRTHYEADPDCLRFATVGAIRWTKVVTTTRGLTEDPRAPAIVLLPPLSRRPCSGPSARRRGLLAQRCRPVVSFLTACSTTCLRSPPPPCSALLVKSSPCKSRQMNLRLCGWRMVRVMSRSSTPCSVTWVMRLVRSKWEL